MHGRHTLHENVTPPSSPGDRDSLQDSADRAQFEQWCELAEDWVLSTLASIALSRSAELEDRSGLMVRVVRAPTTRALRGGARFHVVSLALGSSRLDLYPAREVGETPAIHFALTRAPTTTRFPVIISLPGCLIVRRAGGEIALLGAEARGLPDMRPSITFDAVVLRAFELLIGAHHSSTKLLPS
jgi:hypothetical protein